jgi:hypothetical protein
MIASAPSPLHNFKRNNMARIKTPVVKNGISKTTARARAKTARLLAKTTINASHLSNEALDSDHQTWVDNLLSCVITSYDAFLKQSEQFSQNNSSKELDAPLCKKQ